jgi:hypothetical protein
MGVRVKLKRFARMPSMLNSYEEHFMTLNLLYEWAAVKIPAVTAEGHSKEPAMLEERFEKHSRMLKTCVVILASKNQVHTKARSEANGFHTTHAVHL